MKTPETKTVFFDIGGVFLSNGWGHEARQKAAKKFNLNHEELEELHHFIYDIYEVNHITLDEYLDTVVFNRSRDFTKEDFRKFMFDQSVELPDMLQWFKTWSQNCGFRVISINNEGKELNDFRIKKFDLQRYFDGFVSSCEVGMRKPDPGIFFLAKGIAQVSPEECIYFDDRLMFVRAAQRAGIQSFHHKSFSSTKKILENLKNDRM